MFKTKLLFSKNFQRIFLVPLISILIPLFSGNNYYTLGKVKEINVDDSVINLERVTMPKKLIKPSEGALNDYLNPVYGEYKIVNNSLTYDDDVPDQYESNNSFLNATLLSSSPVGAPRSYDFSIDATLHIDPWWYLFWRNIDEDYYRFDVYAGANVVIGIKNIAVGLDYNLELYMHDNIRYPANDNITRVASSNKSNNENEYISATLSPGTYYARIYSSKGYSSSNAYNFYGSIRYINDLSSESSGSISIPNLKYNMGASAAIWISDLDPFGIKPLQTYAKEEVAYRYYDTSGSMFPTNMMANENPFYYEIPLNKKIPHSILYVWDLTIRSELYNSLSRWESELLSQITSNKELRLKLELTELIVDGINAIMGVALSVVTMNPIISLSVAVGQAGISPITAMLLRGIWPDAWDTSRDSMVNHIRILKAALECDNNTSSNEVVRIPITYRKIRESPFLINAYMNIDYIDFTPEYDQDGYLYNEPTISNYQNDGFVGGKVYGIKSYDDFKAAYNRTSTILEETNTGGNTKIELNNSHLDSINKGEYKWYNFTAPILAEYTFFTEGNTDTYGEIFNEIVPGISTNGRTQYDDNSGTNYNFSISRIMNTGQQIYIRTRGYTDENVGMYSIKVELTGEYSTTAKTILPSDYELDGVYNFMPENRQVIISDEFSFNVNRLRCGYINGQYLTLSAKRKNAGTAYMEFYFNQNILNININIALWSDSEALNSAESSIKLQYINHHSVWEDAIIFDTSVMSKSKDNTQLFSYTFLNPVHGFRIYVTTNSVNNDNNKGRVVIGDIVIEY